MVGDSLHFNAKALVSAQDRSLLASLLASHGYPYLSTRSSTPTQAQALHTNGGAGTPLVTADLVHYNQSPASPSPVSKKYLALQSPARVKDAGQSELSSSIQAHDDGQYFRLPSPEPVQNEKAQNSYPNIREQGNYARQTSLEPAQEILWSHNPQLPSTVTAVGKHLWLPSPSPGPSVKVHDAEVRQPATETAVLVLSVTVATPKYAGPDADLTASVVPTAAREVRASTPEQDSRVRSFSFPLPVRSPPPQDKSDSEEFVTQGLHPMDRPMDVSARHRGETAPPAADYVLQDSEDTGYSGWRGRLVSPKLLFRHKPPPHVSRAGSTLFFDETAIPEGDG